MAHRSHHRYHQTPRERQETRDRKQVRLEKEAEAKRRAALEAAAAARASAPPYDPAAINELLRRLDVEVYAMVPDMKCKVRCGECCGRTFWTLIEDLRVRRYLKERGMEYRTDVVYGEYVKGQKRDVSCPYQKDFRCSIHPARPLVCRLFGVVVGRLHCPHVRAKGLISNEEATKLFHDVQMLSTRAARYGGPEVEESLLRGE